MKWLVLLLGCSGGADTGPSGAVDHCNETRWYPDADGDGWGVGEPIWSCDAGAGYAELAPDCDDTDPAVNPDATETWYDGVDDDCDGSDDDADGDGYGWDGVGGDDCDDGNADIHPDAYDICDSGIDENCDGEPARCGFEADMEAREASISLERNADTDFKGDFGSAVAFVGDSDGDGLPEFFTQRVVEPESKDEDGVASAYLLIEPPLEAAVAHVSEYTVAKVTLDDQSWGYHPPKPFVVDQDLDGDGYLDFVFTTYEGSEIDDEGRISEAARVDLLHGPIATDGGVINLDDDALTIMDPRDFGGVEVDMGYSVDLVRAPETGDDWTIAALLGDAYDGGDPRPVAALFTADEFESKDPWASAGIIWSTGGTDHDAGARLKANDFDGDGFTDLALASRSISADTESPARVWIMYGPGFSDRSLSDADVTVDGGAGSDFYEAVAYTHSFTRINAYPSPSGGADMFVASLVNDETWGMFAFQLPESGSLTFEDADVSILSDGDTSCEASFTYGGDLDADGEDEVVIGVRDEETYTQGVVLMPVPESGTVLLTDHEYQIWADDATPKVLEDESALGSYTNLGNVDFNADGHPDLLLTEPFWTGDNESYARYGRISIFHGGPRGF